MNTPFYNPLFTSSLIYWVETDLEGIITQANNRFCDKFNFLIPELIGSSIIETVVLEDRQKCLDTVMHCFANPGAPIQVTLRKPKENGRYYWGYWEFTLVNSADEKPGKMVCMGYDITNREETIQLEQLHQAALLDTVKNIEDIFDNLPLGVALVDADGFFLDVNPSFLEITGFDEVDLDQHCIYDILCIRPENISLKVQLAQERFGPVQLAILKPDGTKVYLNAFGSLFTDKSGTQKSWLIIQNITEKVLLKRALEDQLQLLNNTGEVAKIGGWQFNMKANSLSWTEYTYHIHEVDADTFIPNVDTAFDFYNPPYKAEIIRLVNQCLDQKIPFSHTAQITTQLGHVIWIKAIGNPLYDEYQNLIGIGGIIQDITEQEKARLKILDQNTALKEIALMQSHVMRHPVSNIIGIAKIIAEEDFGPIDLEQMINYLNNEAYKLDLIIKDIVSKAHDKETLS
jgi:PAS domain S-box-containing protein